VPTTEPTTIHATVRLSAKCLAPCPLLAEADPRHRRFRQRTPRPTVKLTKLASCCSSGVSMENPISPQCKRWRISSTCGIQKRLRRSTVELSDGTARHIPPCEFSIAALPTIYLFSLSIGIVAGLRAMTAPAAVSWAAYLGWLKLDESVRSDFQKPANR